LTSGTVLTILAHALKLPEHRINRRRALASISLDSLTATEIRTRIKQELRVEVPLLPLLRDASLDDLVAMVTGGSPSQSSRTSDRL
jgi:acyl carrier protein